MEFELTDFNGSDAYYGGDGAGEWRDIDNILRRKPIFLQGSGQAGRIAMPIFDPKATNAYLRAESEKLGWRVVRVPKDLTAFGVDWDAGKGSSLAEWQFSNYPFLWNNIIRTEVVFKDRIALLGLNPIKALIVVTKSGIFPASASTLYYEQARAQIQRLAKLGTFTIPIRLVGLTLKPGTKAVTVTWSDYPARYSRAVEKTAEREVEVEWRRRGKYGDCAVLKLR
jgi:hypothetical protein